MKERFRKVTGERRLRGKNGSSKGLEEKWAEVAQVEFVGGRGPGGPMEDRRDNLAETLENPDETEYISIVESEELERGPVRGYAVAMVPRNKENFAKGYTEDAYLAMVGQGVFAVFDGAGGVGGGMVAAQMGAEVLRKVVEGGYPIEHPNYLTAAMNQVSESIELNPKAGVASGAAGRIVEFNGKKKLVWANVGTTRIYLIRDNQARMLTTDEGGWKSLKNALGKLSGRSSEDRTEYAGVAMLQPDDRLLFCTYTAVNDKKEGELDRGRIGARVGLTWNTRQSAQVLIDEMTSVEDRTVLVVEV